MKMSKIRITLLCLAVLTLIQTTALAVDWNVKKTVTVPANSTVNAGVIFTKDGAVIPNSGAQREFINGTNAPLDFMFEVTAPEETNDRSYGTNNSNLALNTGQLLPDGLVLNLGDFLFDNGFLSLDTALDSPSGIADVGVVAGETDAADLSLFGVIEDLALFAPFGADTNFPLGSTLLTDATGQLVPGLRFFLDEQHTNPYTNSSILITGMNSEFIPEPATLSLLAIGGLLVTRRRR